MAQPLLQTKLYIPPPRPNLISRPRLIEQLNAGVRRKLTLLSAPAGFGKTTLLSEWIHSAAHLRVAWLSLDKGDNDLARFLSYLIAALQTIDTSIGQGLLATLRSPNPVDRESVLTLLLNEITGLTWDAGERSSAGRRVQGHPYVLVLDDYHAIEGDALASQEIDQALAFLLDHMPSWGDGALPRVGLHLVIASRTDPTLPLSRLRARDQLTELRTADLRFSGDEAALFLERFVHLPLSARDVRTLEERTEGWITGLQLAALALQGPALQGREQGLGRGAQVASFVESFGGSHRYVIDYLVDEVLDQLAPRVQGFLLQTSVLDRLTAPLCDAVTDQVESASLLEQLESANLFLVPLDGERRWYRYHHLFAELLRQRLLQTRPEAVPTLHRRASAWYASHNSPLEAVQHAFAGHDLERAADLIEDVGLTLIGQGAFVTVRNWIETLPAALVRRRPTLSVYHAWTSSFTHQLEEIEPSLQQALSALETRDPPLDAATARDVRGHVATLRAWNARRQRDNARAIALIQEVAEGLNDGDLFVRTLAALNLGLAYLDDGALVKAARSLREAASLGEADANELAVLIATSNLAAVLILQGRLHEAAGLCRQTLQDQVARHGKPHPTCCLIYLRLAWVLAEWNDLDGFYANLSQAVLLADQIRYDAVVKAGSLSMAWEKQLLAEQGRTIELADDVAAIVDRVLAAETDTQADIQAQNTEAYLQDDAYFEIWPGYSDHARAQELARAAQQQEALDLLAQVYRTAQPVDGVGLMIEARSAQALIYQSLGDLEQALLKLADALRLSEPEGYVRTYADRGASMAQLLQHAADRGIQPAYTARLLAAFQGASGGKGPKTDPPPASCQLVEPLSPRELEVLHLLAQGLSNREICERLFLALSTVKGHNRNIYGKLQVRSRTQAVARARELGLI
jgi:LuxR family maltose regulon positive regulatory protein